MSTDDIASHAQNIAQATGQVDVADLFRPKRQEQEDSELKPAPLPVDESELTDEQLRELFERGERWRKVFPELGRVAPVCWIRHPAHRQEILALWHGWRLVEGHQVALPTWMAWLRDSVGRLERNWIVGCSFSHLPDPAPDSDESHLEDEIEARNVTVGPDSTNDTSGPGQEAEGAVI